MRRLSILPAESAVARSIVVCWELEMRCFIMASIISVMCVVGPVWAEDSYMQPENEPATPSSDFSESQGGALSYDECFRLGWVRGVHVERGEWEDFFRQCMRGRVPLQSGMAVDSVRVDPHSSH